MSKKALTALAVLFIGLTIIHFRYAIFAPLETWMIRYQGSDLYIYCLGAYERLGMLREGFLPLGDYWVPRGGGYPATPQELLLAPAHMLLLIAYAITNSFVLSLKILYPLFYLATLTTAYWYGNTIFKRILPTSKRMYASIVLAVSYTFCMWGVSSTEQMVFVSVPPLILLTLIFLEKTIQDSKPLHLVLTSTLLLSVYLTHLYPAYFLTVFIGARLLFAWKRDVLQSSLKAGILFLLLEMPFFLLLLLGVPNQEVKDVLLTQTAALAILPGLFLFRSDPIAFLSEASVAYLGLTVIILAIIPMIRNHRPKWRNTYIFYLLTATACIIFAIGQYSPINFAALIQEYLPLSFFLRAPGRIMVIGCLSLSVCAALGLTVLLKHIRLGRRTLTTLLIVLVIFADLTIGYAVPSMPTPIPQNEAYKFFREQPGDYRIVEVPSIYPQMALSNIYTDHDTLSTYCWSVGYFNPLYAFADQYNKCLNLTASEQEVAFYGIKYILVNTDLSYYTRLDYAIKYYNSPRIEQVKPVKDYLDSSKDYKLVYSKEGYHIYENLFYQGTVFPCKSYDWRNPNTLEIRTSNDKAHTIYISQSYTEGWIAKVNGAQIPIQEVNSIQSIKVPAGTDYVIVHYERYESSLLNFLAFHLAALLVLLLLLKPRWRKNLLVAILAYGVSLTIFSLTAYPYSTPLYHIALTSLGIVLTAGASIYILLRRLKWTQRLQH